MNHYDQCIINDNLSRSFRDFRMRHPRGAPVWQATSHTGSLQRLPCEHLSALRIYFSAAITRAASVQVGRDSHEARASVVQKPAPTKAKARAPRKVNTANDAENEAPNSRAADVEDPRTT